MWAFAITLLVFVGYMSSYGLLSWLAGRGFISVETWVWTGQTIHRPLIWYKIDSGLPGAQTLKRFELWCFDLGEDARDRAMDQ
jgi:hypothetical protein